MAQNVARRGASNLTVPLMLGAFVLLAGFLYWLSITAEPTAPPEIVEDTVEAMMPATAISAVSLEAETANYVGTTVRIDDLNVASAMGTKAFFVDLPRSPFLIRLGPDLVAAGESPPTSGTVTIVGEVKEMTDSTSSAWFEAGDFVEADRPLVEFASHYIEAAQLRTAGGAASAPAAGATPSGEGTGN